MSQEGLTSTLSAVFFFFFFFCDVMWLFPKSCLNLLTHLTSVLTYRPWKTLLSAIILKGWTIYTSFVPTITNQQVGCKLTQCLLQGRIPKCSLCESLEWDLICDSGPTEGKQAKLQSEHIQLFNMYSCSVLIRHPSILLQFVK